MNLVGGARFQQNTRYIQRRLRPGDPVPTQIEAVDPDDTPGAPLNGQVRVHSGVEIVGSQMRNLEFALVVHRQNSLLDRPPDGLLEDGRLLARDLSNLPAAEDGRAHRHGPVDALERIVHEVGLAGSSAPVAGAPGVFDQQPQDVACLQGELHGGRALVEAVDDALALAVDVDNDSVAGAVAGLERAVCGGEHLVLV